MRVVDLKALTKERELRGYSRLKKAELIAFIHQHTSPPLGPIPAPRPIPALRPPSRLILASETNTCSETSFKTDTSSEIPTIPAPRSPRPTRRPSPPPVRPYQLKPKRGKETFNLIRREVTDLNSDRVQTTTWIRFIQEFEDVIEINRVELAFNCRMMEAHQGSDLGRIVDGMITHMNTQIENPVLTNSRLRFDEVLFLDINFHQLNLTRGSSYLPYQSG